MNRRVKKLDFFFAALSRLLVAKARKKMEIHVDHQKSS
jgi:hypothetical protein